MENMKDERWNKEENAENIGSFMVVRYYYESHVLKFDNFRAFILKYLI